VGGRENPSYAFRSAPHYLFFCMERINARSILPISSHFSRTGWTSFSVVNPTLDASNRCVSNSLSEPCAIRRNWTSSPEPSPRAPPQRSPGPPPRHAESARSSRKPLPWETPRQLVAGHGKLYPLPPYHQVPTGPNRPFLHPYSLGIRAKPGFRLIPANFAAYPAPERAHGVSPMGAPRVRRASRA
jgi:hypothetical protein